jgi:hypothetical protein
MKNLLILAGFAGSVAMVACEEHEVIPPPVPIVDLDCDCDAVINDSVVEYSDTCRYSGTKQIVTGGTSSAQYATTIQKNDLIHGMELEIGSLQWVDDGSNTPTLAQWQAFFDDNINPNILPHASNVGVTVSWTDPNGQVWVSDSSTLCFKNFAFTSLVQDSDTTGDYMLFKAEFNCTMLNSGYGVVDSAKCLENGVIKSAFRLE